MRGTREREGLLEWGRSGTHYTGDGAGIPPQNAFYTHTHTHTHRVNAKCVVFANLP